MGGLVGIAGGVVAFVGMLMSVQAQGGRFYMRQDRQGFFGLLTMIAGLGLLFVAARISS